MPLYDYKCEAGHRYEKRESFGSPPEQPCDRCGKSARRLLNVPPLIFKGSGWYKTDSRGKEPGRKRSEDGESKSKVAEKSESKAESTSESKPKTSKSSSNGTGGASSSSGKKASSSSD